jgi:hypothetical protein
MVPSGRYSQVLTAALVCACVSFALTGPAYAAPITVNLRVEGSSSTLFEGPVAVEAIGNPPGISTNSSAGAHPCDVKDNGKNEGFVPSGAAPTAALYDAATTRGLAFDASWSSEFNDFFVSQVGTDVNGGAPEFPSWGYAVNYTTANVGGCQFQLAPGSDVLWAYNYFNLAHLLSFTGPTNANVGIPVTVRVTDGQTGQPISAASIGELAGGATTTIPASPMTDANGEATITLAHQGSVTLKATRADSVRSNGLVICVHNGNDGSCGTTLASGGGASTGSGHPQAPPPPIVADSAKVTGVTNGHVYPRRSAPRLLGGVVDVPAGGTLRSVRIRLERRRRGHCFDFSGSSERFVRARRCGAASFFSVGATESFSYLLPTRLPPGRYVYDVQAVDGAGHSTKLIAGVNHVVFRVE